MFWLRDSLNNGFRLLLFRYRSNELYYPQMQDSIDKNMGIRERFRYIGFVLEAKGYPLQNKKVTEFL